MKKAAFTLIELLVVIAIISIFSALLVPTFSSSFERRKLNAGLRQVMSMVELARSSALARNRTFRIYFDSEKNSFYLASERDPLNAPGAFEPLGTEEGKPVELPDEVYIRGLEMSSEEKPSGTFHVSFYKDGSCDEAVIHLEDYRQGVLTIYMQPGVSRCKVFLKDVSLDEIKDVKIEPIKEKKEKRRRKSKKGLHAR